MKKYFRFTLLTLAAALLFTACSNEEEIANGGTPNIEGGVTFTFPAPKAGTTYATTPGIGFENDVDLANTTILMFDDGATTAGDPKLEAIYSGVGTAATEIISGTVGTNKTATVVMPTTGLTDGKKTFRFVVNTESATDALATLAVGQTLSTIKDLMTEDQPAAGLAKGKLLMGGTSAAIDISTVANGGKITLKRRVARFDIQNDMAATVDIKRVEVYGSKKNGYVLPVNGYGVTDAAANLSFSDAAAIPAPTTIIDLAAANMPAPGLESAFYLYPTTDLKTTIQLTVVVNGNTKVLTVPARAITANTRYILKPNVVNGVIGFELEVAPWDDATEIATAEAAPIVSGFSLTTNGGGTLNADALTYEVTHSTAATVITFNTLAATNAGVNISVVKEMGDLGVTTTSTPVGTLTYAAGYPQTHTIKIPAYAGGAADISNKIVIKDKAAAVDATGTTIILWSNDATNSVLYPGTGLKPVVVGGVTWAPVNVGATTNDATTLNEASMGKVFQYGRNNIGWVVKSTDGISDVVQGPVSYDEATTGIYKDNFIADQQSASSNDWLLNTDTKYDERMTYWNANINISPCPTGWRVPTSEEMGKVREKWILSKTLANKSYFIKGDDDQNLYFPLAGYRHFKRGNSDLRGTGVLLWTSTRQGAGFNAFIFYPGVNGNIAAVVRASALSVRCVKI